MKQNKGILYISALFLLISIFYLARNDIYINNKEEIKLTSKDITFEVKKENTQDIKQENIINTSNLYRLKCASCHGNNGSGLISQKTQKLIAASLIGKTKEQILKSIEAFHTDSSKNPLMFSLLKNISKDDILKLAEEIESFK